MNNNFTVEERIAMIGTFRKGSEPARGHLCGAVVVISCNNRKRRANCAGIEWLEVSRDALHEALLGFFPSLEKVEISCRGDDRENWLAVVKSYKEQIISRPVPLKIGAEQG